jgi:hypothetical protein
MTRALLTRLTRVARIVAFVEPRPPVEALPEADRARLLRLSRQRREAPEAPFSADDQAWFETVAMAPLCAMPRWRASHAAWRARLAAWVEARTRFPAFSLQLQARIAAGALAEAQLAPPS